ncbi:hypothetical protein GW17_00048091, partial [Ensete ventricosum]
PVRSRHEFRSPAAIATVRNGRRFGAYSKARAFSYLCAVAFRAFDFCRFGSANKIRGPDL